MLCTSISSYLPLLSINYLSIYLLFYVVYIYLCLPPPPLSIYCSMLYTSICAYLLLLLLSILLSLYLSIYLSIVFCCIHLSVPTSPLSYYLSLSIVLCCIHLSVPTSSSSSLSNYLSISNVLCCIHLSICSLLLLLI